MRASSRIVIVLFVALIASAMFATGLTAFANPGRSAASWYFGLALVQIVLFVALACFAISTSGKRAGNPAPPNSFKLPRWGERHRRTRPSSEQLIPVEWGAILAALDSGEEAVRRHTIQMLIDGGDAPIAKLDCWPVQRCTNLQLMTAEVLVREWAAEKLFFPKATERDLIHRMFEEEPPKWDEPCVSRIAVYYPDPPALPAPQLPELSALFGAAMDRVNAVVKDTILDWKPELPEEDPEPEDEIALGPLDRPRFVAELSAKFTPALEYIAETVAASRTNFDLAKTETEVGHFLHELRWDALNLALESRAPDEARALPSAPHISIPPPRRLPLEKPAVTPSGGWGKKYRRMRALGF